jgi:hypothetical protein
MLVLAFDLWRFLGELLDFFFPPFLARLFHSKNREFATEYSNFQKIFPKMANRFATQIPFSLR